MSQPCWAYDTQVLGYLLECTMATYEGLCLKKTSSKAELRRHESIIRNTFRFSHKSLATQAGSSATYLYEWRNSPRVRGMLKVIETDGLEEALSAYFKEYGGNR